MSKVRWVQLALLLCAGGMGASAAIARRAGEKQLARVLVTPPHSTPVWELQKANDHLIILSDFSPRRASESVYVDPDTLLDVVLEADAYVTGPGVVADDSMSLWRGMWMWHAYRKTMHNPGNAILGDILNPDVQRQWSAQKTRYLGGSRRMERWRPWYAAFKLYEAALARHGVGKSGTLLGELTDVLQRHKIERVDGRYHMTVDASKQDVREFEIDADQGIACLQQTLNRLGPTFDTADEGADAWDGGDLDALREYFERVPPLERCWEQLINQRIAALQGIPDPYAQAEPHWMDVVQALFKEKHILLTYLPVRTLVSRSGVVARMIQQGWTLQRRS